MEAATVLMPDVRGLELGIGDSGAAVFIIGARRETVHGQCMQQTRPNVVMDCWVRAKARWCEPRPVGHRQERLAWECLCRDFRKLGKPS